MQKVVLTVQTGKQVFVPSWWFGWKHGKSCSTGFLSDINPLWLHSSCPFAHTELPLSNCHGSLLLFFAWTGKIMLFLRPRSGNAHAGSNRGEDSCWLLFYKVRWDKENFNSWALLKLKLKWHRQRGWKTSNKRSVYETVLRIGVCREC